ncbi:hypothetical protein B0H16DRAFT_1487654 [Mycena metata]|uniref:Uncharacterized protein n=1 Tax=Mycena metata TaxID=1033252 RepID=A0AAD7P2Z9_9AGAR|nr:hypothetical protein B0H16DRAFT_1487654 [Mycena metata]
MTDSVQRYRPFPWPWIQPSILVSPVEDERYRANYWLDADLEEDDNSSNDYLPSEAPSSDSAASSDDSMVDSASDDAISESELADLATEAKTWFWWRRPPSPTPSEKALEDQEDLARKIADLVKAEEAAAAVYNPEEIVSLITQLYELLITMGHWPDGCIRYAPHTDPPVNEELAVRLGYAPACIALMHRLPYLNWTENHDDSRLIVARSHFADYTKDRDLKEGRRGWPYEYMDGCPDYDPWMLPIVISGREGTHVMLDTVLGTVRAWSTERGLPEDAVEWRRHGEVGRSDEEQIRAQWTEYRRTPLVPAAHYFSEVIFAYRSLLRLPFVDPDRNDPKDEHQYHPSYPVWMVTEEREEHQTLLTFYREYGWPNQWRRAEFLEKWTVAREEIRARARQAMEMESNKRRT